MRAHRGFKSLFLFVLSCWLLSSCAYAKIADVPVFSSNGLKVELTATDEAARAGVLPLGKAGSLNYMLRPPLPIPVGGAIEIEYEIFQSLPDTTLVFSRGGEPSWALPPDASFLGIARTDKRVIRYRVPVAGAVLDAFRIEVKKAEPTASGPVSVVPTASFTLRSLRILGRAYGFSSQEDAFFLTPFVYRETSGKGVSFSVEPPVQFRPSGAVSATLSVGAAPGTASAAAAEYRFLGFPAGAAPADLIFPAGALPADPFPFRFESRTPPRSLLIGPEGPAAFPDEPISADPGLILSYRVDRWRDPRYEVFRWQRFPSILIFDTADYAVQERLFKRLAFFVEKAGFRGRLASDAEIAGLHGWNAHDYRAEDLAAFFGAARTTGFELNGEERELLRVLLSSGILQTTNSGNGLEAGKGAIVSISRESEGYLRSLFMVHEAYHGLFFLDQDFRSFATTRYRELPAEPKEFLKAYFDSRRYDVRDEYLMTNELMAYCLQQPVESAQRYFGETLPVRLEKDPLRNKALPQRSQGYLPYVSLAAAFGSVSREFDSYVAERWGTRAGRVALVYQISRANAVR